jgi:penicillin-insensitive murein endopeptidase
MPQDGHLQGGAQLPESGPGFRSNPRRPNAAATYGTVEMVQGLMRAAAVVDQELPGSVLFINDMGLPNGGPIAHHGSHRAGRDVDVLFYLLDRHRDPMEPVGAFLDERGRGYDFKDLSTARDDVLVRLDARRTWRFMQALLEGPYANEVQRIFLAEHLRTLLLQAAVRARAPRAIRDRFGDLTCQPSAPHDDHMHIRFFCSPEDLGGGCEDVTPVYSWRRAELHALGIDPVLGRRGRRGREPSPHVEFEPPPMMRAGHRHPRVLEWLAKREAWLPMPHPGRPYCR